MGRLAAEGQSAPGLKILSTRNRRGKHGLYIGGRWKCLGLPT